MAGHSIKYRYNEDSGVSRITVPRAILEAGKFNWKDADELKIIIESINGNKGLFIYKPAEENGKKASPKRSKES